MKRFLDKADARTRARRKQRRRPRRLRSPRYAMYRLRRVGQFFDAAAAVGGLGLSALAVWRGHSLLFGLSLFVVMLPVAMCCFRSFFAGAFGLPAALRGELNLHTKQALWTFAVGFLVVAVKTLAEPPPKGVADPVSLLVLVVLVSPLVQHAVKARHVFDDVTGQLKDPLSRKRMPGRIKHVGPPSSRWQAQKATS